jgi:hypothetical protein
MPYNTKPIGVAYADPQLDSVTTGALSVTGDGAAAGTAITAGTSASPVTVTSAVSVNKLYVNSSATDGDTRTIYTKLKFTGAGSGETLRTFAQVTAAATAVGGTVNSIHASSYVDTGGTISGAANAIRATFGGTSTNPGGTLAVIQLDSDFATGGTWTNLSFLRCTNSGTGAVGTLLDVPTKGSNLMFRDKSAAAVTQVLKITSNGTPYYIMVSDQP